MRNSFADADADADAADADAEWFGTTREHTHGLLLQDLFDEQAFHRNRQRFRRVLSGAPETDETRLRDGSGAVRGVQVTTTPLVVNDTVSGFSLLLVELTPWVYAEAELRTYRDPGAVRRERERISAKLHDGSAARIGDNLTCSCSRPVRCGAERDV